MREEIDKDFLFPPSLPEARPVKRHNYLVPFVLVVLFIGLLAYFY